LLLTGFVVGRWAALDVIKSGKIIAPKLKEIADDLSDHLDTRVSVELGKQKGKIVIEFATIEDLERINKVIKS
jgi:ParB family chromosome partitioning protein